MTEKVVFNPSDEKLIIQRTKREPKLNRGTCVVRCSAETWQPETEKVAGSEVAET